MRREEWFLPGTEPDVEATVVSQSAAPIRVRQPTPGLQLALDPRLPPKAQAFEFLLDGLALGDEVHWTIDGEIHSADDARYLWQLSRGDHNVRASVWRGAEMIAEFDRFQFTVK